jgi:predicted permease
MKRNPVFAAAAIASLGLGIGANLAIFGLTMGFLFSEPSVKSPRSLAYVILGGNSNAAPEQYRFLRDSHLFDGVAGVNPESQVNWRRGENSYRVWGARITNNFFDLTGSRVLLGRPIHSGDEREAVLSYSFWRGRLGGDSNILGHSLVLDGALYTVVGVLPPDHQTLIGFGFSPDLYLTIDSTGTANPTSVMLYARLPAHTSRQAMYPRLLALCRQLDRVYPQADFKWAQNTEIRGVDGVERLKLLGGLPLPAFFGMLMAVVGLVLLIACANVASLLLARAASRQHELAIRQSIAASRGRIVRQLLVESFFLASLGTVAGLVLALVIAAVASRYPLPLPIPLRLPLPSAWRLMGYAIVLALLSSVLCGLMPALKATKRDVQTALKLEERSVAARSGFRRVLVVLQFTVSVVLLLTGFLFLRNLALSNSLSPGFDTQHTVWALMRLVPQRYLSNDRAAERKKIQSVVRQALEKLRSLPGVESAATVAIVPLNDNVKLGGDVLIDERVKVSHVLYTGNWISPGYFQTMGIPLLAGRDFRSSDRENAPPVVVLNESVAHRLFGNNNAIGHTLRFHGSALATVVGVAKNSKYFSLGENNLAAVYWPEAQSSPLSVSLNFVLRTLHPESILREVNRTLGKLDSTAAIQVKPMNQALGLALLPSRVGAALLGSMGILGLLLTSVGLYGLLAYSVNRRIREIGIRVAVGARLAAVAFMVVQSSLILVGHGPGLGRCYQLFRRNSVGHVSGAGTESARPGCSARGTCNAAGRRSSGDTIAGSAGAASGSHAGVAIRIAHI